MDKTKFIEVVTKIAKKQQKIDDFVSQLFDKPYRSLVAQRRIYLQSKNITSIPVFIEEATNHLSNKKKELWNDSKESTKCKDDYDLLMLIIKSRFDLIIKYFEKPEFNLESMRDLISEFRTTTKDFSEQTYTHNSYKVYKTFSNESAENKVKAFKESQSKKEVLIRLEQYIKNPVNRIGKQQLARICFFALELGLIRPSGKAHDEILIACNTALSLNGKLELKKTGLYLDPLDENGRRISKKKNKENTASLIKVFEKVEWKDGIDFVKKVISK